jgi:TetR/AcrR family acrAB operon transcriptional repressor
MARKTKADAEQTKLQIIDAARRVFFEKGVSRSTLEDIAAAAGVTRGAVYWHFKDKTDLFFAMRRMTVLPLLDQGEDTLLANSIDDPLLAVERALAGIMQALENDRAAREIVSIMMLRCEFVGEFATVVSEINKSRQRFLGKVTLAYQRAKRQGLLREGFTPQQLALDTMTFFTGLIYRRLMEDEGAAKAARAIKSHIALRRTSSASPGKPKSDREI